MRWLLLIALCAGCRTELPGSDRAGVDAAPPDLAQPRDFAVSFDLGARDFASPPPDLASSPDLAAPPDLAVAPDLAMACHDDDGDGYTNCGGDCDDADPLINPGAKDIGDDDIDYDCDGKVTVDQPCDANLPHASVDAKQMAQAIDVCPDKFFVSATWATLADDRAHRIAPDYGVFKPRHGVAMGVLASGIAADADDKTPDFVSPQPGTAFDTDVANPLPMMTNCAGEDPLTVQDMTELRIVVRAPTNAQSFSFDFNFLSAEYPEFVCVQFNDKFLALLQSKKLSGNVSTDGKGNPITVNNGFFTVVKPQQLAGTGYDAADRLGKPIGGGTGWLTTTSPVTPGETITLRFIIFDEGDHIYDSAVMIDHFRWQLTPSNGPHTGRDGGM